MLDVLGYGVSVVMMLFILSIPFLWLASGLAERMEREIAGKEYWDSLTCHKYLNVGILDEGLVVGGRQLLNGVATSTILLFDIVIYLLLFISMVLENLTFFEAATYPINKVALFTAPATAYIGILAALYFSGIYIGKAVYNLNKKLNKLDKEDK